MVGNEARRSRKRAPRPRWRAFPTWVINGKKLEGEQTLEELAKLSGFEGQNDAASMVAELF
jgi:hypothetical protein